MVRETAYTARLSSSEEVGGDAWKVDVCWRSNHDVGGRGCAIVSVEISKLTSQIELVDARQLGHIDADLERVGEEGGFGAPDSTDDGVHGDAGGQLARLCVRRLSLVPSERALVVGEAQVDALVHGAQD